MTNVINAINTYIPYILIGLVASIVILLIMLICVISSLNKLKLKYKKFMRGTNNANIEELINNYLDKIDKAKEETEYVKELYSDLDKRVKGCVQKVAIVRYRAFDDVGSDLSYSIALLDSNNNGVILTSIFGRNESTTYAKPVDKGISRYELSSEENQVLENCINSIKE
ncbi:DUF4446 family protein [Clostridium niameyense]|uniref:DUF4446 family protein n=1 Tax=Clostridium niameyense TaxID=1622073 RepID=A0A6M0RC81_9CLOT|nr:DUF4446 family protein [Clostridium niameyense]NEZ47866.1 DUF4446 family protein [Clostridium niameyense]